MRHLEIKSGRKVLSEYYKTPFTCLISILQDVQGFIRGQQALQFESEPDGHNEQRAADRGHGHRRGHSPPRHRGQRTNAVGEQFLVFVLISALFSCFFCSISLVLIPFFTHIRLLFTTRGCRPDDW